MNGNKKIILGCLLAIAVLSTVLIIKGMENVSTDVVENEVISQGRTVSAVPNKETRAAISSSGPGEAAVSSAALRKKEYSNKKESVKKSNDHKKEPKKTKEPDKKEDKKTDRKTDKSAVKKADKKSVDKPSVKIKSPEKNTGSEPKSQNTKSPEKSTQAAAPAPTLSPAAASATVQEKNECSLTITCQEVFSHMDKLSESAKKVIPKDGIILKGTFTFEEGETVFDVLKRVCKEREIHLDYVFTPLYSTYYIKGIHNLYEFDCGDESGWMYSVNGKDPGNGCNKYKLKKGDQVVFNYTCEY
ncbi:MAG: DUF4430 domain-containing protein [Eubacterium sp.]|nr:DUF4430 domain-containing protein [Eubacterium sp.]